MAGIQLRFRSQEKFDVRRDRHCEIVRPWAPIGAKNAYIHNIHFISTNTSMLSDMRRMTVTGSWQNLKENILKLNHRTSLRYFNKKWRRLKNKESYRGPGSVSLVGLEDKWITSLLSYWLHVHVSHFAKIFQTQQVFFLPDTKMQTYILAGFLRISGCFVRGIQCSVHACIHEGQCKSINASGQCCSFIWYWFLLELIDIDCRYSHIHNSPFNLSVIIIYPWQWMS